MPGSISNLSFFSKFSSRSSSSSGREYKCTVQLLDDSDTFTCDFHKNDSGQVVFDKVCEHLEIVEKDYFGLRFMDLSRNRYWLDLQKPILRQVHGATPIVFCLRVRYYPADPTLLAEEITRYQLFLQLRRDMLHGRLYCPHGDAAYLGACIVQSEVGDYDAAEHPEGYVSEYKLFLKQTAKLEDRVADAHKALVGQTPADAEMNFLRRAATLDTYGFDPYTVKDMKSNNSVYVGVTHQGVLVYQASRKMHHVKWDQVDKVDYVGKQFRLYPKPEYFSVVLDGAQTLEELAERPNKANQPNGQEHVNDASGDKAVDVGADDADKENVASEKESRKASPKTVEPLKYLCPSATFAKHLWRHTLSQKAFFTCDTSAHVKPVTSKARVPVFMRGAKFRYSGRVLHEIAEAGRPDRQAPNFVRFHVERQPGRADRQYPWVGKYNTLPRRDGKKEGDSDTEEKTEPIGNTSAPAPSTHKYAGTADWVEAVALDHNENRASEEPPPQSLSLRTSNLAEPGGNALDGGHVSPVVDLSPTEERRPNGIPPFQGNKASTFTSSQLSTTQHTSADTSNGSVLMNHPGPCDTLAAGAIVADDAQQPHDHEHMPAGSFVMAEPVHESTPIKRRQAHERNKSAHDVPNGGQLDLTQADSVADESAVSESSQPGVASRILRSLLLAILGCLILFALMIAIVEVCDTSASMRAWLDAVPGTHQFRHFCYEPLRHKVVGSNIRHFVQDADHGSWPSQRIRIHIT